MENRKQPNAARFANAVLVALALWCVVLGIVFHFTKPASAALKYQAVLAVVAVGALLARRLSVSIRERLALTLVSVVVCLVLIEVVLYFRFRGSVPDRNIQLAHRVALAEKEGRTFDTRNTFQVVEDLRNEGVEAYPNVPPNVFIPTDGLTLDSTAAEVFPFGSVSGHPTVFCNEDGTWSVYETDEHGFNNPDGAYSSDTVDVVVIGDSFAQGACVAKGDDIASQLRLLRPEEKVVNLGAYGSGPLLELAILKEYGRPLHPKKVLWLFFEHNDLTERGVLREVRSPLLMRYLEEPDFSQGLLDRQPQVDSLLRAYIEKAKADYLSGNGDEEEAEEIIPRTTAVSMLWFEHLRMALSELKDRLSLQGHDWGDRNRTGVERHEWLRRTLVEAKQRVEGWGGELYFVYVPAWKRYTSFVNHENLYDRGLVLRTVHETGIPVIDLHEAFSAHPDPLSLFPLRIHGHYTAEGYAIAARHVDGQLRELESAP
ncbi:MAG TPA: hypothetical protein VF190_07515 [Rhodothermales bacterium]